MARDIAELLYGNMLPRWRWPHSSTSPCELNLCFDGLVIWVCADHQRVVHDTLSQGSENSVRCAMSSMFCTGAVTVAEDLDHELYNAEAGCRVLR